MNLFLATKTCQHSVRARLANLYRLVYFEVLLLHFHVAYQLIASTWRFLHLFYRHELIVSNLSDHSEGGIVANQGVDLSIDRLLLHEGETY